MYHKINQLFKKLDVENHEIKFLYKWLIIGLVFHIICAIFSSGFNHFDEHWQILEFMNTKLGNTSVDVLPWEYRFKMRSWTQPGFYYLILKPFINLGLTNPFYMATILRIISSLFGWVTILWMCITSFALFKEDFARKWFIRLATLLYFIPFIHARPSSEAFGSSFFIIGLCWLILDSYLEKNCNKKTTWQTFFIGLILGLSFTFRFQMGFVILFIWIWYAIWGSRDYLKIFLVAFGVVLAVLLQVPVDRWGYGEWTSVAWNYLDQNILQDKASNFPTAPWYFFITKTITRALPPVSIVIVFSWLVFWIKRPKHPITFGTFPLFIIHSIIAAKAFRYMSPLAPLTPFVMIEMYKIIPSSWMNRIIWFLKLCLVINCVALVIVLFRPAKSAVKMYQFIYDNKLEKVYYSKTQENPYTMVGLPVNFYKRPRFNMVAMDDEKILENTKGWIFLDKGKKIIEYSKKNNCTLKYSSYPIFFLKFNYFNWLERSRFWALFKCR